MLAKSLILLTLLASPAAAVGPDPWADMDQTGLILQKMKVSWECRDAIGEAHYWAARSWASVALKRIYTDETAKAYILEADAQIRTLPPRGLSPHICYGALALINLNLERSEP